MAVPASTLPPPGPEAALHGGHVHEAIAEAIDRAGGWLSFAEYMRLALHAPALGYYATGAVAWGPGGDFVTAPELSPLFGECLARQCADVLGSSGGDVLELGPGSGALAVSVLRALEALDALPERYRLLELSAALRARQQASLEAAVPHLYPRCVWLDALPAQFTGVVLANEVLDAVPVHLVVWTADAPLERGVVLAGTGFGWEDRPIADALLLERAQRIVAPPGYLSEISLEGPALAATVAGALQRGVVIFIDYGFGAGEYYHPQRSQGTLMCHYRHRSHPDPLILSGLQDITAHVDFTAVAEQAVAAGATLAGYTTQARFLVNCGVTERLAAIRTASGDGDYARAVAQAQALLSPAEMGELFKVIAFSRDVALPLRGFAQGDLSRLL